MFDSWQSIVALVSSIAGVYLFLLWIGLIVWTYQDIRERTHDGWSQAIYVGLVGLFTLPGLVLYLLLRPHETLTEAYERKMEAEALMRDLPERRTCPRCDRQVREEFLLCPYCRTTLREPCVSCSQTLDLNWTACPYCGAQGPRSAPTPAPDFAPAAASSPPAAEEPPPTPRQTPRAAGTSPPGAARPSRPPS